VPPLEQANEYWTIDDLVWWERELTVEAANLMTRIGWRRATIWRPR
jgi:hypothetical protein